VLIVSLKKDPNLDREQEEVKNNRVYVNSKGINFFKSGVNNLEGKVACKERE
jgi:hypothetical protein